MSVGSRTALRRRVWLTASMLVMIGVLASLDAAPAPAAGCLLGRLLCTPPTTVPPPVTTTTAPPLINLPPLLVPPAGSTVGEDGAGALRLLELANAERSRRGLPALSQRDDVARLALAHSRDMAARQQIFHNDDYFGSAVKTLLGALVRGENVAVSDSVDDIHARLMASSPHRANLLDGRFSVVGIAVIRTAEGRYFATQDFLQPRNQPAPAGPAPSTSAATRAPRAPRVATPAAEPAPPAPEPTVEVLAVNPVGPEPAVVAADIAPLTAEASPPLVPAPHQRPPVPMSAGAGSLLLGVGGAVTAAARRRIFGSI